MTAETVNIPLESGDPIEALSRMTSAEHETFKRIYSSYALQQLLRANGRLNLFLGALTVYLGISHSPYTTPAMIQTIGGIIIVLVSFYALAKPQPLGIAAFSIVFLLAGLWNLYISIPFFVKYSDGLSYIVIILGIYQLWGAFRFYKIYRNNAKSDFVTPARNTGTLIKAIRKALIEASVTEQNDVVQWGTTQSVWHGILLPTLVMVAPIKRGPLLITEKSGISFSPFPHKTTQNRTAIPGQLNLAGKAVVAKFDALSFSKYTRWKTNNI